VAAPVHAGIDRPAADRRLRDRPHHRRRHAVVMMVNHAKAADSQAAQDALLEWVWAGR
jgi:hypothetical protein